MSEKTTSKKGLSLNERQEKFCELIFASQGTNTPGYECAISAGYAPKAARQIASRLLTFANIQNRLNELHQKAESKLIAGFVERQKVATEIVRGRLGDFSDEKGNIEVTKAKLNSAAVAEATVTKVTIGEKVIETTTKLKLRNPLEGIDILNKMDKLYESGNNGGITVNQVKIVFQYGNKPDASQVIDLPTENKCLP